MNKSLDKCVRIIKNGGIAIFPTDTAFGVGCMIDNKEAVKRLFRIRKRPENKPILVLAASQKMVKEYVNGFSPQAARLAKKYWPGGLTIIFPADTNKVLQEVRGGGTTIGIRVPAHATIRALVRKVGVPILAPSANFSGEPTPFKFGEINPKFAESVDFVMPGKCKIKEQSTVVDATGSKLIIIRQGAVKLR